MTKNPILDELHAVREQLLADAGGTLDGLVDRLQQEEQQSDRPRFKAQRTTNASLESHEMQRQTALEDRRQGS